MSGCNFSQKKVEELREMLLRQDDDVSNFIDDEAVEVNCQSTEDSQDLEEVVFVGETSASNKKRRLE